MVRNAVYACQYYTLANARRCIGTLLIELVDGARAIEAVSAPSSPFEGKKWLE